MKNETFTPERIKAEADAFFEWDGEDRSLVTTTSCLLFAQHIAGLMQARSAQPAPVVPEGSIYVECRQCDKCQHVGINDAAHGLAARHDCDWSGNEPEDDKCPGCKSENCMAAACPECGARYALIASEDVAAAPAQGQQVEWRTTAVMLEQANAGLAQLNGKLRAELAALKAQQVGQKPVLWARQCDLDESDPALFVSREKVEESGYTVPFYPHPTNSVEGEPVAYTTSGMLAIAKELPLTGRIGARCKADERWNVPLYTAPQPAPAQDVAGWIPVTERLPEVETDVLVRGVRRNEVMHRVAGLFNGEWSSQETEDLLLGEVTHWMPLPAAPALSAAQAGGGEG